MMKKILNVGCGTSTYGTHFIDLYPQRPEVIKCDVDKEKFPFPNNFFDEVYAECIFEHLKNPLNFLTESYRVLKKNGKIIIITDNAGLFDWQGKCHHGKYEKIRKKEAVEDKHYALYTPHHLKNWLSSVGFRKIKIEYFINKKSQLSLRYLLFLKLLTLFNKRFHPKFKGNSY